MKNLKVGTSDLMISNGVDDGVVGIYAGLIARKIKGIHRTVVTDIRSLLAEKMRSMHTVGLLQERLQYMRNFRYLIVEGNHRAVAHGLFSNDLPCTLLQNEEDIRLCITLADEGKMSRFVHGQSTMRDLFERGIESSLNGHCGPLSVEQYLIKRPISFQTWPKYITDQIKAR